jgi:menaquinone-dependent protoporphyrinogen oxidase
VVPIAGVNMNSWVRRPVADRSVWMFSSGPIGDPPKPADDAVDVAAAVAASGALEHRVFAGRLSTEKLSFAERAMVRVIRSEVGDFRDWDEITSGVREIDAHLSAPRS